MIQSVPGSEGVMIREHTNFGRGCHMEKEYGPENGYKKEGMNKNRRKGNKCLFGRAPGWGGHNYSR